MSNDIVSFLTNDNLNAITNEILAKLQTFLKWNEAKTEEEKEQIGWLDCNYNLKDGKMKSGSNEPNTYFAFDFDKDSVSYQFMKAMYSEELSEKIERQVGAFVQLIAERLIDKYIDQVRSVIRESVLCGASEIAVPLKNIKIISLEVVDYSATEEEDKHVFRFAKMPDITINMQSVQSRVLEVREDSPGKSFRDIVLEERDAGNPVFQGILDVQQAGKFLWDLNLSIAVDYSFSDTFIEANTQ